MFHENHSKHKTTKFSFSIRELLMGAAVGNMIEPFVNKEFHMPTLHHDWLLIWNHYISFCNKPRLPYWPASKSCIFFYDNNAYPFLILTDFNEPVDC